VELLLSGAQQDFPVVEGPSVLGVLRRGDLLTALARRDQQSPVSAVMQRDFAVSDPSDMLDSALQRLQGHTCHTMPVGGRGTLIGCSRWTTSANS
jgi:CBS-domain-containing membrane protein